MKKTIIWVLTLSLHIGPALGQYVTDFQAIYPFYKGLNSTKNFAFTKDNSLISSKIRGYMLMATSQSNEKPTIVALAALKLNVNFGIISTVSYVPAISSEKGVSLIPKDVISNNDGTYIVCGSVTRDSKSYGFIAKFDSKLGWIWYKEYPELTMFNAIINVTTSAVADIAYIACGTYNSGSGYANGIIVGLDPKGHPIWKNTTMTNGKSDKIEYNDLIPIVYNNADTKLIAVAGNSVSQQYSDKNVVLTMIDIKGNKQFSNLYGLMNDGNTIYDEEGFGLTQTIKDQIVISGRTKCYYKQSITALWDDALLFAIDINGKPQWSYRYDMPHNTSSGEYAQKVLNFKEDLYVSGYYKSNVFTKIGSIDAFLIKTDLTGTPSEVRVYGDIYDDLFFAQEINHKGDGIISSGYTSSFSQSVTDKPSWTPYIVERYEDIKELCKNQIFELKNEKMELEIKGIDNKISETKCVENMLTTINNPTSLKTICSKFPLSEIIKEKTDIENLIMSQEQAYEANLTVKLHPNPTNNILTIEGAMLNTIYTIHTGYGKLVTRKMLKSKDIDVADLKKGIYFITANNGKDLVTLKFVKE